MTPAVGPNVAEREFRSFFRERGADVVAQAVVLNLFRAQADVFSAIESVALRPRGLTHAGFVLLLSLWTSGPQETRTLARIQGVSRPAIVSAVDTLERAGLVRRRRSHEDRRLVTVEITRVGVKAVDAAQRAAHDLERTIAGTLSKAEQRHFAASLRVLAASAREVRARGGTRRG